MTTKTAPSAFVVEREIRIDAPRERVFALVSDAEQMRRWFRPSTFEPHVGGIAEFTFPFDHEDWVNRGTVTVYEPPSRLAYTWSWHGAPDVHTEVTFDLSDEGGSTLLRLTHTGFVDEDATRRHEQGWTYWLERLSTVATGGDPGPDTCAPAERRREQRAALLREEIALRDHVERVAAQRRALEMPDPIDRDYTLAAMDGSSVQFSELFGGNDTLLVYHMMFHPDDDEACPMCSMWVDGFNGVARHVWRRAPFVVISKAPVEKLREWARRRDWNTIKVFSSYGTTFNRDMGAEDADGDQLPIISVFRRTSDGIHQFYRQCAAMDADEYRGIDLLSPVWHLFDLTPEGRGDWLATNAPIVAPR